MTTATDPAASGPAPVTVTDDGPIRVVTIDRPEVAQRRRPAHRRRCSSTPSAEFDADDALSVAVLTGAGGTFCAGADLKAVSERPAATACCPTATGRWARTRMLLGKPVIAAVEGYAVAGGLELAAVVRPARGGRRDAVFGVYCRRWGVPLIDGGTVRLPRLIGHSHALDLILTGRGVSGDEALRMGLANRLTEPGGALDGGPRARPPVGRRSRRSACAATACRATSSGRSTSPTALSNEYTHGIATISSGETLEGAARFASGEGRHGAF